MQKSYSEKLKDPRWQKKRLQILERDDWRCQNCFDKEKTLHVHHLCYMEKKDPWDYEENYLLTLCHECHEYLTSYLTFIMPKINVSLKLKLKDPFILNCALETFNSFSNLHDIIYLLWELKDKEIEVHEILREQFQKLCNG